MPTTFKKILEDHEADIVAEMGQSFYDSLIADMETKQVLMQWVTKYRSPVRS